ncbi:hypothetical protein Tco_0364691 [Tanacetum coccineum]
MNSTSDLQAIINRPPKWCHVACQQSPEPPTDHRSMMVNGDGQRWSTTARPPSNSGRWQRSTTVNGGEPPLTTAGTSVNGTTSTTLTARLLILNLGEYDLWLMWIEQYFLMTDYSLWEVILNGNKVLKRTVGEVE